MSKVPHYELDIVREAAKCEQIQYSRSAQRDVSNLGLEFSDVIKCILALTNSNFYKSYDYGNGVLQDAYKFDYNNPGSGNDETDSLYIKFRMINNYLRIDVSSFHLDR